MGFDIDESNGGFSFKLTGLDRLFEKLTGDRPGSIQAALDEGAKNAEMAGSKLMISEMVSLAPRDSGFMTEHLEVFWSKKEDGIVSVTIKPNLKAVYPQGADKHGKSNANAAEIAWFNEFGHRVRSWSRTKRGKNKGQMKLRKSGFVDGIPFITIGFETSKSATFETMTGEIKAALEKL
jgi:hypothetical protein